MELNNDDKENGVMVVNVMLDFCKNECRYEVVGLNLTGST